MTIRRPSNDRLSTNILVVLAIGTFIVGTDGFVLNGLLPVIAHDLRVSESAAGQLTTSFALTYAIASPLIAAATGRWDRRTLLAGGLALFTVGMAGQALAADYTTMVLSRILAAVGAAAFQANAYVVAGALASDARRGRALATVAGGMSVSMVLGVPIGVFFAHDLGWRAVMWAIGGISLLGALAMPSLPSVRVPAVTLKVRLSVLVRPAVLKVLLVTVLGISAAFTVFVYLPLVVAPSATGTVLSWVLVGYGIGQVAGNNMSGRWTDRFGTDRVRMISLAGMGLGMALLTVGAQTLVGTILVVAAVGTFAGMIMVPQQHRLFAIAPDAPTVALGLNGSAIYLGGALGSAFGGLILIDPGVAWLPLAGALVALCSLGFAYVYRHNRVVAVG
ncbi:MFS transporter [Actinocrispum wychmicini]|uniref:Putative MFS family arabinose efflux permease n=1 Tax=Actinocrispum wychmicini TaxID=1213861 RepID=A0A4R2JDZ7_9PSEU|nr:MFS transporter [Actinocrispum wychmicini]TCO55018.1 putative MFS family arabinose efflux permease [Actinocrispum wychmicini]